MNRRNFLKAAVLGVGSAITSCAQIVDVTDNLTIEEDEISITITDKQLQELGFESIEAYIKAKVKYNEDEYELEVKRNDVKDAYVITIKKKKKWGILDDQKRQSLDGELCFSGGIIDSRGIIVSSESYEVNWVGHNTLSK